MIQDRRIIQTMRASSCAPPRDQRPDDKTRKGHDCVRLLSRGF